MSRRFPLRLALAGLAALAIPATVQAGSDCCACPGPCASPILSEFYVVNQGPTFTGPGIVLVPGVVGPPAVPPDYPYVGRDFAYPGYWAYSSYSGRVHRRHGLHRHLSRRAPVAFDPADK